MISNMKTGEFYRCLGIRNAASSIATQSGCTCNIVSREIFLRFCRLQGVFLRMLNTPYPVTYPCCFLPHCTLASTLIILVSENKIHDSFHNRHSFPLAYKKESIYTNRRPQEE